MGIVSILVVRLVLLRTAKVARSSFAQHQGFISAVVNWRLSLWAPGSRCVVGDDGPRTGSSRCGFLSCCEHNGLSCAPAAA